MNLAAVPAGAPGADRIAACAPDERWICQQVYRITGSENAADAADALAVPLRIGLVLLLAWIATLALRRVVEHMVQRIRDRGSLSLLASTARIPLSEATRQRRAQRAATVSSVLRNVISIVVWSIAVLVVMSEIGIDIAPIIAGAGVVGIALGFGAQTMVRDYLAGLYIVLEDQYGVGDEIDVGDVRGVVEWVSLRMTRVRGPDGVAWYVGNGEIRVVGNRSQRQPSTGEPDARRTEDGRLDVGLEGRLDGGDDAEGGEAGAR